MTITEPGHWVVAADGSSAFRLSGLGNPVWWSPDSTALYTLLLFDGQSESLRRVGLDGSVEEIVVPDGPTPDGPLPRRVRQIHVAGWYVGMLWMTDRGWGGTAIMDFRTGLPVEIDSPGSLGSVSADGRMATATEQGVRIFGPDGHLVAGPIPVGGRGLPGDWSPDGARVLVGGMDACVLELASAACTPLGLGSVQSAQFAPDSRRLAVAGLEGGVMRLWVTEPGGTPRLLAERGGLAAWDPTGERIAWDDSPYQRSETGAATLRVINSDGSGARTLVTTRNALATPLRWSPDGRWIVVGIGGPV